MNKQGSNENPNGGIEWTHFFGPGTGYTANPVRGCRHQCRWRMGQGGQGGSGAPPHPGDAATRPPVGDEASPPRVITCYAEAQRDRLDGPGAFQNITFHPEVLAAIRKHKTPAGIFIDSMSDLFATAVNDEWIDEAMQCMWDCPQHTFFSLTKNPSRLTMYFSQWMGEPVRVPQNLFLGVSLPPTFMFGKELNDRQRRIWFEVALEKLCACDARVRWVSLEPLSWDCSDILAKYRDKLHWAVIGAASDGARTYQPAISVLNATLAALGNLPVFYKGNLRPLITNQDLHWRQEFPKL